MKVLVACEWSGRVREAFRAKGHDAWSCDIDLNADWDTSPHHIQDDVLNHLEHGWDMMIAFPPCTALCVSGNGTYADSEEREEAVEFFRQFLAAPIPRICVENPVGVISSRIRKPDQYIQPYEFGHPESKKTGLWLRGLPLLQPTKVIKKPARGYWNNQTPSGQNKIGPSPDRGRIRGETYQGIAEAMAEQWG